MNDIAGTGVDERRLPLAVDLDGTLARVDSLHEALITAALRSPKYLQRVFAALRMSRIALKSELVDIGAYRPDTLPLREDFLDFIRAEKESGREVHLVTASPEPVAEAVARRVGLFDSVIASKDGLNLKGVEKARMLEERFPDGFSYAGNDASDLEIWSKAKGAIPTDTSPKVRRAVDRLGVTIEREFPRKRAGLRTWLRMMRIHQWTKNVLLFVPLILSHRYGDPLLVLAHAAAFLCMGLVASATYILNDLSDLDADRRHPTKRRRPLAAADISVAGGLAAAAGLGLAGMLGALLIDRWLALCLAVYCVLTLSYTLRLKALPLIDIFVLGSLYTIRVLAGVVILRGDASPWLLSFSFFFFFSLSMAKRHVEIARAMERGESGRIKGRGYRVSDAPLTLSLGIASGCVAIILLFMYVANDSYPAAVYSHPQWLWAVPPIVFLWVIRIWLKSHRCRLDDDPILFALRDRPSLLLGLLAGLAVVLASI